MLLANQIIAHQINYINSHQKLMNIIYYQLSILIRNQYLSILINEYYLLFQ